MQLCINSVQERVSENSFKFSTSKTVCVHFHQQYVFFMIFIDSLSALQVLKNFKTDHPLLIQIQELLHKINADKKETFYVGSWTYRYLKK